MQIEACFYLGILQYRAVTQSCQGNMRGVKPEKHLLMQAMADAPANGGTGSNSSSANTADMCRTVLVIGATTPPPSLDLNRVASSTHNPFAY